MKATPFAAANKQYKLTRHGAFDAQFDTAYVLEGDLTFPKNATGADILHAFGFKKTPDEPGLFVVTGQLTVKGGLDLDAGIHFSMGLAVLGDLAAKALRLDMTMLFVFGDARVEQGIFFETNGGTLSIARKTICPLVVCHEGDLNIAATGEVFDSTDDGPVDAADTSSGKGFPSSRVTMKLTEARERLVATVFEDDEFDGDKAYRRAAKGQSLFRPVKPGAKAAPGPAGALKPVPIFEATNVTSLVSDGENLWMGAASMLMFDGKRFTRMWRKDPKGTCDNPSKTPTGLVFTLVGRTLVVSGSALPAFDAMLTRGFGESAIPIATSDDLGVSWKELVPPTKFGLVARVTGGVAMFRERHTLSRARSMAGPWSDVRIIPEGGPRMTAQCITSVGKDLWLALVDSDNQGAVYVISGDEVRRVDHGTTSAIRRIIETSDGGVLLLGDANTVLRTTDGGRSFTKGTSAAIGNIADATRVGDAVYAVGGLPLSKKPKDNLGFVMRSQNGGRTFEMIVDKIPGRMWAVAAHGDQLFLAGTAKTAFSYALPKR